MSNEVRLFKIDPSTRQSQSVTEIDFAAAGFQERRDIQEWVADNPTILGEELLIIAKEFSGFDKTHERADLVAVDRDGNVVVIELKRDDTGSDVHWQAIKYASYFQHAKPEDIVRMLAKHERISESEAIDRLTQHLDTDGLDNLNREQRILLASHRFAPEVTSAVLWLNENARNKELISCIQLTPYRDHGSNSFYIQASTILPIPGIEDYTIGPGSTGSGVNRPWGGGRAQDEITRFLRGAVRDAVNSLPDELNPNRRSPWAGVLGEGRYYDVWYSSPPWGKGAMLYRLHLLEKHESTPFEVIVRLTCDKEGQIKMSQTNQQYLGEQDMIALWQHLAKTEIVEGQTTKSSDDKYLRLEARCTADALDTSFRDAVADTLHSFMEAITPAVEEIANSDNEQ